jgi:RNA polymerase primary sigma factor
MENKDLEKYIKKYMHNFDFLDNIKELEKYLDDKYDSEGTKKIVKRFVKEEIQIEYEANKNKFIKKIINKKIKSNNIDEYLKIRILDIIFGVIKDESIDKDYFINMIGNNISVKRLLDNLFFEEDRDASVYNELKNNFTNIVAMFDAYKEKFFVFDSSRHLLSHEETKELFSVINNEDMSDEERKAARDEVVVKNLGLARKMASQYMLMDNTMSSYEDLYHDGIEGLYKAVERFDVTKDVRFSTYAIYWIRQTIKRSLDNNSRLVRIPVHTLEKANKNRIKIEELERENGHLSDAEIMEKLGITKAEYEDFKAVYSRNDSLDRVVSEDTDSDERTVGSFVKSTENVEETATNAVDQEILRKLIEQELNPREQYIIFNRFGFNGEEKTFSDLAKEMKVSRQRVHQIEFRAFEKLARLYKAVTKYDIINDDNRTEYEREIAKVKRRNSMLI